MAELTGAQIREQVRERYAAAATAATPGCGCAPSAESSCCGVPVELTDAQGHEVFGGSLYDGDERDAAPESAVAASLGCGVPTAVADLRRPVRRVSGKRSRRAGGRAGGLCRRPAAGSAA